MEMKNSKTVKFEVKGVSRIEGHGKLKVFVENGKVKEAKWIIPESARFFEAMLKNQPYDRVADIVSRICGICSIGHYLASVKAIENALGLKISAQTLSFRKLLMHAATIQSHILHVGYLAAPDFVGASSVIPLTASHLEVVKKIIKLHKLGNDMSALLGGRTTHPTNVIVGGFSKLPTKNQLSCLKKNLESLIPDLWAIAEVVKSFTIPEFKRETEYVALKSQKEYAFYDGEVFSTDDGLHPVKKYMKVIQEYCVPHSTAKYAKHCRESYMVGALARFNVNFKQLHPLAKKTAEFLGLSALCYNPYMNTVAQVVETVHSFEDSIKIIDEFLKKEIKAENVSRIIEKAKTKAREKLKEKTGIGIVEVPRGILVHHYVFSGEGLIVRANCIIPTGQNHGNIQSDIETLVPLLLEKDKNEKEIQLALEMLVRAYDPCISCSTHEMIVDLKISKNSLKEIK